MKKIIAMALGAATVALAGSARAEIIIYAGYYDLTACCGNTNPLPDPWVNSPNTTFLGDSTYATSSDPDESALRLYNNGGSAVTLDQGATVGVYTLWDALIGAGGFSIGAGQNVILGATNGDNFDGSDIGLVTQDITISLNGVAHHFQDSNSILLGFPTFDETIPWTEIGAVRFEGGGVPEPASWALMIAGFGLAGASLRRRRAVVA